MILANLAILVLVAAGAWWLTGFDKTPAGEDKRGHHLTRALRTVAVVFLSAVFLWLLEAPASYGAIPLLIIVPMSIAIVLRSSLAEIFAHGFLRWIDPELHDQREFDPRKAGRYQDAIAHLIHNGRREEAIKLCEELKESGEVDLVTLEQTLEYLGVRQADRRPVNPLNQAALLRTQQKFAEAETLLQSLLKKDPTDAGAALMLMRLYAQDLQSPERAYRVLQKFEQQPHVDAAQVEFARRSIPEWVTSKPDGTGVPPDSVRASGDRANIGAGRTENAELPRKPSTPESDIPFDPAAFDRLLAAGSLGSAVELLEHQIKVRPMDWGLQLKLAEVYAVHCRDLVRAEKIVQRLEQQPGFGTDQTTFARAKLEQWRTGGAG